MTPRVSVLIPCRNAEPFLAETIESALGQSLPPHDVVVVDDASTDRSRAIAAGYGARVTVVSNPGAGASAARNHASSLARGDYFQYLDADDLLEPHALASRAAALERAEADVAISDWLRLEPRRDRWEAAAEQSGRLPDATVAADVQIFRGFWAPPAAILYRRRAWDRVGAWSATLPVIQDARFLFDAVRTGGSIVHVPGVGAKYRQHVAASLSTSSASRFWRDILQNTREVERLWTAAPDEPAHAAAIAEMYAHCVRAGFKHDRVVFDEARAELKRFPEYPRPRFVRAATFLNQVAGYRFGRALLSRMAE